MCLFLLFRKLRNRKDDDNDEMEVGERQKGDDSGREAPRPHTLPGGDKQIHHGQQGEGGSYALQPSSQGK